MNDLKNCSNASKAFIRTGILLPNNFGIKFFLFLIVTIVFFSCGSSMEDRNFAEHAKASQEVADSVSSYMKGISTDTINGITHNFIKKANLKFKVQDVLNSSKKIEDIVAGYGGYISSSELSSNINNKQSTQINKDSILEQTYYTTINLISIRVPSQKLDTVLRQISDLALFIDFRNMHSDDVKMKLFSNKLAENRYTNYKNSVKQKAEQVVAKQSQIVSTQNNLLEKQTFADEKRIDSYDLADQVNYSSVTLETYQTQSVLKEMVAIPNVVNPYQMPFYEKLGEAFLNGFSILKSFILFLVNSWSILLILALLFIVAKKLIIILIKKVNTVAS